MTTNKISAVINTYNAGQHLERVLRSLEGFDEILICDMESTDSTVEIAERFGCRVVTFPKGEHKICEPARDFAIHCARHPWVLVVDADEIVPDALREYLYQRIADPGFTSALAIARRNLFLGRPATASPDYQLRFFLKDRAVWPATIHSRPKIDGRVEEIPSARKDLYLIHLDDATIASRIDKMNRYSDYEVEKRSGKSYGILKTMVRPWWWFIRTYIFGGGFRDGRRGLIRSYMTAVYQMMFLAKIYESRVSGENPTDNTPKER